MGIPPESSYAHHTWGWSHGFGQMEESWAFQAGPLLSGAESPALPGESPKVPVSQ